jgi:hypothetical protein
MGHNKYALTIITGSCYEKQVKVVIAAAARFRPAQSPELGYFQKKIICLTKM